jgi:hypothetical protein
MSETKEKTEEQKTMDQAGNFKAPIAGELLSSWIPISPLRKLFCTGIITLAIYGLLVENYQVLVWLLILPFQSPRIIGAVAYGVGWLRRKIS